MAVRASKPKMAPPSDGNAASKSVELPQNILAAMGTDRQDVARARVTEYVKTLGIPIKLEDGSLNSEFTNVLVTVIEIEPKDEFERMLVAQMIACHQAAMKSFGQAMLSDQNPFGIDMFFKHATKLMAAYAKHVETINKHRGKGQQKVTVEHVHVAPGGQAIVGNIETPEAQTRRRRPPPQIAHQEEMPNALDALKTAEPVEKMRRQ